MSLPTLPKHRFQTVKEKERVLLNCRRVKKPAPSLWQIRRNVLMRLAFVAVLSWHIGIPDPRSIIYTRVDFCYPIHPRFPLSSSRRLLP